MSKPLRFLEPPGATATIAALKTAKGKAFAAFLRNAGGEAYAQLIELRRVAESGGADVIIFQVQVERPQQLTNPIHREERLAVIFSDGDMVFPEVLALRSDFPRVPHTNLRDTEFPRSVCLYDQPYENVKLDWTPARFLNRIRYWLQKTATGNLHGEDQPLEPLLLGASQRLILPGDYSLADLQNETGLFQVFRCPGAEHEITLVARRHNPELNAKADSVAAIFCCGERTHGVIEYQPANLEQLHDLSAKAGLDLGAELATKVKAWLVNKPTKEILQCKLIIILLLPKTRRDGTRIEAVEQWAFMTLKSVEDVAVCLNVFGKEGGTGAYILGGPSFSKQKLAQIPTATLQVLHGLSAGRAASMNGTQEVKSSILAIGMGALGSQIFNNLIRSGFGHWTLVDLDTLLPHNCARHFLGEWAVGQNKAQAMSQVANAVLDQPKDGSPIAKAIPADILKPGKYAAELETECKAAEVVLDLSASVAVSRHCATSDVKARHIAAFLNPAGNSLIITAEDKKRRFRLDWLEMLHYRAVLTETSLKESLQPPYARFRYGNSCRDVSTQLAQDDTAIWAGIASKTIRQFFAGKSSKVRIFSANQHSEISIFDITPTPLFEMKLGDWLVRFDKCFLDKLSASRKAKLPNETGGVLLGHFDTQRSVCSIIDIVESPPDSEEWPTSYIRGCVGLQQKVTEAETQTLSQIGYVGEWHSHPKGATVLPSIDDFKAYGWLSARMMAESLPGIMLIIGDAKRFCLVSTS
jgi:integrative and conjugative element protein (TIGR02256 family)